MPDAKIAPNLPQWMLDHIQRYLSSGGTDGHMYKVTPPGYAEMHAHCRICAEACDACAEACQSLLDAMK